MQGTQNESNAARLQRLYTHIDWMLIAAVALALPIILLTPLLSGQLPGTNDAQLHLHRLVSAALNWREGIIWPRWAPQLHLGFGYPIGNFYAPGWHVVGGLFVALGIPAVTIWLIAQTIGILLYPIGGYLWGRQIGGRTGALVGAAVFLYAPFRMYEIFEQGNLSQFMAMGLTAWVLWSLARCAIDPRPGRIATAGLFTGALIVTHHPTAFVFIPFAGLYSVIVAIVAPKTSMSLRRRLLATVGGFGLGVILAAIYWLPALSEIKHIQLQQTNFGIYQTDDNFVPVEELLGPPQMMDKAALNPPRAFNAGQPQMVLAALGFIGAIWPKSRLSHWQRAHAVVGAIAVAGCLYLITYHSAWLWHLLPQMQLILFPWRFMGVVTVAAVPGAVIVLESLPTRWQPSAVIAGLVIMVGTALPVLYPFASNVDIQGPVTPGTSVRYELASGNLGAVATYEYTPRWSTERPQFDPCPECYDGWQWNIRVSNRKVPPNVNIKASDGLQRSGTQFKISTPQAFYLEFHQFYFPGWVVTIDSQPVEIAITEPEGLMAVDVPAGDHIIEAWYAGTTAQHAGDLMAIGALLICAALYILDRRQSRVPIPPSTENLPRFAGGLIASLIGFALINTLYIAPSTNWFRLQGTVTQPANVSLPIHRVYANAQGTPTLELVGMSMPPLESIRPGQWINVRLYWHTLQKLEIGWRVALKLQDQATGVAWANSDNSVPGGFSTSQWPLDRYVVDLHTLRVSADAPPYVGNLAVEMYRPDDGQVLNPIDGTDPLPVLRVADNRCDAPPADAIKTQVRFGESITVTAFQLTQNANQPDQSTLDVYWHVEKVPTEELAAFVHIMHGTDQIANADQPPIASYSSVLWMAGQCLHNRYTVNVPPSADRVLFGYYERNSLIRLPAGSTTNPIESDGLVIAVR